MILYLVFSEIATHSTLTPLCLDFSKTATHSTLTPLYQTQHSDTSAFFVDETEKAYWLILKNSFKSGQVAHDFGKELRFSILT